MSYNIAINYRGLKGEYIMFALNFLSPHNEKLLMNRQKNVTIRLGDIKETYPENSIVWITVGKKTNNKRKLYPAIIDKAIVKYLYIMP